MKRSLLVLLSCLLFASSVHAATIRNKLRQKVIVKLAGGKTIQLPPDGTASVNDKDLASPQLQSLVAKGQIAVIKGKQAEKK